MSHDYIAINPIQLQKPSFSNDETGLMEGNVVPEGLQCQASITVMDLQL